MKKYLKIFQMSVQKQLQYRLDLFLWLINGTLTSIVYSIVWLNILGSRTELGGFSKADFVTYYMFSVISTYLVQGYFAPLLADGIKNGDINLSLSKPYNIVVEYILREQAFKLVTFIFIIPGLILISIFFGQYIEINMNLSTLPLFVLTIIMAAIIFILLNCIIASTAFWLENIWFMNNGFWLFLWLFGGYLIPLNLMPRVFQIIADLLPFKYIFSVPATILLGKNTNILQDLLIQALYILILYVLYKLIWNRGMKSYVSVGG